MFDTNYYIYASIPYPLIETLINEAYIDSLEQIIMPQVVEAELKSIPKTLTDKNYKVIIDSYIDRIRTSHPNNIIPLKNDIIDLASEVRAKWKNQKNKKLALPDSIIGATAVIEGATLYTHNEKDFSFFIDNYGLEHKNLVDSAMLNEFLEKKGLVPSTNFPDLINLLEQLNEESLRSVASTLFNQVGKKTKRICINSLKIK